jgi:hypothetical protein
MLYYGKYRRDFSNRIHKYHENRFSTSMVSLKREGVDHLIRKLLFLAVIVILIMTFKTESAFDLNSGRMKFDVSIMGIPLYHQIKETPLSRLKAQFFPGPAEPDWYVLNTKSLFQKSDPDQHLPLGEVARIALMLNNDSITPEQKRAILKNVWDNLKAKNYDAIGKLHEKLEQRKE